MQSVTYKDKIWCDVLAMGTMGHMILGRPWLFDLDVTLRGKSNTCTFTHKGQRIKLVPSQPKTGRAEKKPVTPEGKRGLNLISPKEFKRVVVQGNRSRHLINLSLRTQQHARVSESTTSFAYHIHKLHKEISTPIQKRNANYKAYADFFLKGLETLM